MAGLKGSVFLFIYFDYYYYLNIFVYFRLILLALGGSLGMTMVILACALNQFNSWWPFFVVLFYVLSTLPTLIAKRNTSDMSSSPCLEFAIFVTVGIVLSTFALPIVMARAGGIHWGACYLTVSGNIVVYLTLFTFFTMMESEDQGYGGHF